MKKISLTIMALAILSIIGYGKNPALTDENNGGSLPASTNPVTLNLSQNPGIVTEYNNNFGFQETSVFKNTQTELSALWTAVTLEIIIADVFGLFIPESMEEWTELADGKEKEYMLGGAAAFVIPISMVYLSQVLPYKANRIVNLVAVGLTTTWVIAGASWNEPSYILCLGAELAAMSLITWKVLKWENPEDRRHNVGLNINPGKKTYGLSYAYRF